MYLFCKALQKRDKQLKDGEVHFSQKWGMKVKNQVKLKEKEPKIDDFGLKVAQREGFEPSCGFPQTDFESSVKKRT